MDSSFLIPQSNTTVLFFLLYLPATIILFGFIQRFRHLASRNSLLRLFSNLHAVNKESDEITDVGTMLDAALAGALQTLAASDGCVLLDERNAGGLNHTSVRGFSPRTALWLTTEPLRTYLATWPDRRRPLTVLSGLQKPGAVAGRERDSQFQEFLDVVRAAGLSHVMLVALATRGKSYGVLLAGRRHPRGFQSDHLQLARAIGSQMGVALQNRLLIWASQRHDEELKILYTVGRAMRETFDIPAQMDILRSAVKDFLGEIDFALSMQDFPEGPLETVVPFVKTGRGTGTSPASRAEHEVVRHRAPRLIVDDWQWAKYPQEAVPGTPRLRTWCGVPIHFSDGSMGVLAAASFERERAISVGQFELIKVLAYEAAGAFENARVFQREQRRASHLALLSEIGQKATSVLNPQELLPKICTQVREAFGHDLARIDILDRHGEELVVEAEAGYGVEMLGRRLPLDHGLSGAAAETGQPVLTNSVQDEPRYVALAPGVRSSLSLPLKYQEELLGVLSLESRREHAFAPQDLLTLKALADQLAIALHNARAYQFALEEAITDGLTGLKTHRYFMEALEREWRRSSRTGRPFSIIMMDLDQFKPVNDRHGHLEGDRVLSTVARLLSDEARQSSVLARYGGDEFSILLPDATVEQATVLADRVRGRLEKDTLLATHNVTASFGIGAFPENGATHELVLHAADAGMYLAKHEHGNCIRVASSRSDPGEVEAYLGVEFKRRFSTGPETFNSVLARIETAIKSDGQVPLVDTVTSLARAIDLSDHYTRDHGQAVARLATQIARQLGLPESTIEEVRRAGILHDIGKIGIPDAILYKPARLTPEEFEVMKSHTVKGQQILEPLRVDAIQRIGLMVRHHHEMFDGGGYPDRLKGRDIPLGARILTVADCFDTMVSQRAYKQARTLDEAIAELLRCNGMQFDPDLVRAFLQSIEICGDPCNHAAWNDDALAERSLD